MNQQQGEVSIEVKNPPNTEEESEEDEYLEYEYEDKHCRTSSGVISPKTRLEILQEADISNSSKKFALLQNELTFEQENDTNSLCCGTRTKVSKTILKFIAQFTVSVMCLIFSFYKLSSGDSCENTIYTNLIFSILGLWVNSPTLGGLNQK